MLPDDVYREKLEATLLKLEAWADTVSDCATIDIKATREYWRLSTDPFAFAAAPLQLMIDRKQRFALSVGAESYDDNQIDQFDDFERLVEGIANGSSELVEVRSAVTDELLAIETCVHFDDGRIFSRSRKIAAPFENGLQPSTERRRFPYLAYRR